MSIGIGIGIGIGRIKGTAAMIDGAPTGFILLADTTSNILLANTTDKLIRG